MLVLAGIAYAVAPLVDRLTLSWFVRDLDARSSLLASAIQEPLQEQLAAGKRAKVVEFFNRITRDERLFAVGYCASPTAKALAKEGYISEVKKVGDELSVSLTYRKKEPLMLGLRLVSRPSLRVYVGVEDLEKRRKPETLLISTPKGIVSAKQAIAARVGGEAIVEVW